MIWSRWAWLFIVFCIICAALCFMYLLLNTRCIIFLYEQLKMREINQSIDKLAILFSNDAYFKSFKNYSWIICLWFLRSFDGENTISAQFSY